MKHRKYVRAGCALLVCLYASLPFFADSEVPCLVLSGQVQRERRIDLSKLNRIYFGPESMTVSSTDGRDIQEHMYSVYHHIEIKHATPDIETGINMTDLDAGYKLLYLQEIRSLLLESADDDAFSVGVFDLEGHLLMTANIKTGEPLPLEDLHEGIYVAVATDRNVNLSLKFKLQ